MKRRLVSTMLLAYLSGWATMSVAQQTPPQPSTQPSPGSPPAHPTTPPADRNLPGSPTLPPTHPIAPASGERPTDGSGRAVDASKDQGPHKSRKGDKAALGEARKTCKDMRGTQAQNDCMKRAQQDYEGSGASSMSDRASSPATGASR